MNTLRLIARYLCRLLLNLLCYLLMSFYSHAASVSVDYLRGEGDVEGVKVAWQYYDNILTEFADDLRFYVETSINFWEYGTEREHDTNFIIALSPVLDKTLYAGTNGRIFGELGIGISLLDDTTFAGKNVSTHYQFEDRLGVGYEFGSQRRYRMVLRYFHYSNGGVKKPNPGLDFISFSFAMLW